MRPSIRLLAAISRGEPSSKLKKPVLGLEEVRSTGVRDSYARTRKGAMS